MLLCLAGLAGCASAPAPVPDEAAAMSAVELRTMQLELLREIEDWVLGGRIGLKAGNDGWNGSLRWTQRLNNLDFRFTAPLGVAGFRIHGDDEALRIKTSQGEEFYVTDPAAELDAMFGWSIPVHSMRYWMLGLPDPRSGFSEEIDALGNALELSQRGWVVEFDRYRRVGEVHLPGRIVMRGGDIRIRVAVDNWRLD